MLQYYFRCVHNPDDLPLPACDQNTDRYRGSALTTIGSFGYEAGNVNNLVLDHLIISSGIVDYTAVSRIQHQLCYAKLVDRNIPRLIRPHK